MPFQWSHTAAQQSSTAAQAHHNQQEDKKQQANRQPTRQRSVVPVGKHSVVGVRRDEACTNKTVRTMKPRDESVDSPPTNVLC